MSPAVFVVVRALFSENTLMVNVMGVFAHMHQATRFVAEQKALDRFEAHWSIKKHTVSGTEAIPGTGWLPGGQPTSTLERDRILAQRQADRQHSHEEGNTHD